MNDMWALRRCAGWLPVFCATALFGITNAYAQVCARPASDGDVAIAGVVNTYWTPATGTYSGTASIPLGGERGASATLAEGDLVLVIQMQCANINSSDSLSYGDGAAGEPASGYADPGTGCLAGRYQFVRAGAGSNNAVLNLIGSPLTSSFEQSNASNTTGRRTFQVIRVPQYANAQLANTVTASEWNGNNGGVVVLDVAFALDFNGRAINVDGLGFRGGGGRNRDAGDAVERFRWDDDTRHASKGEGIAGTPRYVSLKRSPDTGATAAVDDLGIGWGGYPTGSAATGDFARGAPGNAGGGGAFWNGSSDNGGGGGGGNGGAGGRGAAGWRSAGYAGVLADYSNVPEKKWGFGGGAFLAPGVARLIMGGGGGAGDNNNNSQAIESSGAAGGGIVMVRAGGVSNNGAISARGARAADNPTNDGAGGGGAGGSVLVVATTWSASLGIDVGGGRGGDAWPTGGSAHGSGGGGAGGVVITSTLTATVLSGGAPGVTNTAQSQPGGATHGAQTGEDGVRRVIAPADDTPGDSVGRTCQADLQMTKTNTPAISPNDQTDDTLASGATTTYTLVVTNAGPRAATGAVVRDTPGAGLNCPTTNSVTCTSTAASACPGGPLTVANLINGLTLGNLPATIGNNSVTFAFDCTVQ